MERPILLSGAMVLPTRALDKTETRRLAGLDVVNENPDSWHFKHLIGPDKKGRSVAVFDELHMVKLLSSGLNIACPYGAPGDILWVRENFRRVIIGGGFMYQVDHPGGDMIRFVYKPSIHMPRDAARYFLQVKEIGVERLHDITEMGAAREGMEKGTLYYDKGRLKLIPDPLNGSFFNGFQYIWHKLNGSYSWDLNPWVWVIKFSLLNFYHDEQRKNTGLSKPARRKAR